MWNGTNITGPVLIYHDELVVDDRASPTATPTMNGTLICTSQDQARVGWHIARGSLIHEDEITGDFRQTRTGSGVTPSVSRLSVNGENVSRDDDGANGLWTCRLNGDCCAPFPFPVAVGLYGRGGGELLRVLVAYVPRTSTFSTWREWSALHVNKLYRYQGYASP